MSSVWAQELPPSLFGKIKIPLAVQMFCSTVTVAANFKQFFNGKEEKNLSTSTGATAGPPTEIGLFPFVEK